MTFHRETDNKTGMCPPAKCVPPLPKAINNIPLASLGCVSTESKNTLETFQEEQNEVTLAGFSDVMPHQA